MKQESLTKLLPDLLIESLPIWRPIPSRQLAKKLGVSLQSLANWRVRGTGPDFEPYARGKGNRTFYRPDNLLSWLSGGSKEPWEFSRDWLVKHGLEVEGGMDREATEWMIENVDSVL